MASSSTSAAAVSCTWKYDVFPSFSGEDVRKSFLSHLLKELDRKLIITFIDHGIERSRPIAPELLAAIRDSNIAVVIFSEKYASSTWCLNELVEIHNCYEKLGQIVIPIFYKVDPSHVRKQTGKFGEGFSKTCEGKTDGELKTKWKKALSEVASIAGEDSLNWSDEAKMIEQISKDVSNKLFTPTDDFGDFVGIKDHIEEMKSKLYIEFGGVRMVGIVGPSGIGKTIITRALYSRLKSKFHHHAFVSYKRAIQDKEKADFGIQLSWVKQFLSDILGMKDINIDSLGVVEQRLRNKRVLVVLDDVDEIELLDTLVGKPEWFGHGSRIIVVTQDIALLKSHGIDPSLIYKVQFPSREVALEMFIRSAFRKSCPDDFMGLAVKVAELAGNLPLSLNILGSSLRGKDKKEWEETIPRIQGGLGDKIGKILKVSYSKLDRKLGKFGEGFSNTCEGKPDEELKTKCNKTDEVASNGGEDSLNWSDEAKMIEQISKDVSNKLFPPRDDLSDFVGIDVHIEEIKLKLCLESEEARMVGIVGPSGIGKTTIARALFCRLSSQFPYRVFKSYKRTINDDNSMKLAWEEQFLSDILGIKDIEIVRLGTVKRRLKNEKVLVVLDDVVEIKLLDTLVGQSGWFGPGSRVIVVTQDWRLLTSHGIDPSLTYEVPFPSTEVAREMFCRYAFGENSPPDGFTELVDEVAKLTDYLPLGLHVLGSSLRGSNEKEWEGMKLMLQNGLEGGIREPLKLSYDRLDNTEDKDLFLYIACLFNGESVTSIKNLLEEVFTDVQSRLEMLASKSFIRIHTPDEIVQMHNLLQKFGIDIVREESIDDPGKRRFLVDQEDIRQVLTNKTGTENVLGICLDVSNISEPFSIDENSFERMRNLQFIKFYVTHRRYHGTGFVERLGEKLFVESNTHEVILQSNGGPVSLPPKLRLLHWHKYPWKYIPANFEADYLVELVMEDSKLERLWEGPLALQRLKKLDLYGSRDLKKIPKLSEAKNLKVLSLLYCSNLMVLPKEVNFKSLEHLDVPRCAWWKSFLLNRSLIPSSWFKNIHRVTHLRWHGCPLRCMPSNFCTENLVELDLRYSEFEKLWKGVQPLENLKSMDLSDCENLKEIPYLSKASELKKLDISNCKKLEVLPTDANLVSLEVLDLSGCSRLRSFPLISTNIRELNLKGTAIAEVPSWIENMSKLDELDMSGCKRLKNISASIFNLRHLRKASFDNCFELTSFSDASVVATIECITDSLDFPSNDLKHFDFNHCSNLDQNAREFILGSSIPMITFLPSGEVPTYFTHRSYDSSLIITLPQSLPSHEVLQFKACIVIAYSWLSVSDLNLKVGWRFRGLSGVISFDTHTYFNDHMLVFNFGLADFELNSHPSTSADVDYDNMEFEVIRIRPNKADVKIGIEGCGIRLLNAS